MLVVVFYDSCEDETYRVVEQIVNTGGDVQEVGSIELNEVHDVIGEIRNNDGSVPVSSCVDAKVYVQGRVDTLFFDYFEGEGAPFTIVDGNWTVEVGALDYDFGETIVVRFFDHCNNEEGEFIGVINGTSPQDAGIVLLYSMACNEEIIPSRNSVFNYPNPFNSSTVISVDAAGEYIVDVYNVIGEKVAGIYNGYISESILWEIDSIQDDFISGIYFISVIEKYTGRTNVIRAIYQK